MLSSFYNISLYKVYYIYSYAPFTKKYPIVLGTESLTFLIIIL